MHLKRACIAINELCADGALTKEVAEKVLEILSSIPDFERNVQHIEELMLFLKQHVEIEKEVWESIVLDIPCELFSDKVIAHLYNNHIADIELAHLQLSDEWLKKYSKYDDEATITLGIRMYSNAQYSSNDFFEYIFKHQNDECMLEILLDNPMTNFAKANVLLNLCGSSNSNRLRTLADEIRKCFLLAFTQDVEMIRRAYLGQHSPYMLMAISQNIITPSEILNELVNVRNIKCASAIRANASTTLKVRKALWTNNP